MARQPAETVGLTLRLKESLRSDLERVAKEHGASINNEVVRRLETSLEQDSRVGGPEMVAIVNLMAGAFLRGGQRGAQARGHPEWTPSAWMNDAFAYKAAVQAVLDALEIAQPVKYESQHPDPAQRSLHRELHGFFASVAARGGAVKVSKGDKK